MGWGREEANRCYETTIAGSNVPDLEEHFPIRVPAGTKRRVFPLRVAVERRGCIFELKRSKK